MAKVKLAAILDDVRGKIGNTVFQDSPAGLFIRGRVIPINPNSSAQVAVRANMTTLSKAWSGLTDAQRQSWDTAAASGDWRESDVFGESFNLSGEQLFIKLNMVILEIGESQINTPPSKATFGSIVLGAVTAAAGTPALTIAFTGALASDTQFYIEASAQVSQGIMSANSVSFRKIDNTTGSSPLNVLAAYNSKFGSLVAGKKIWFRVYQVADLTGEKVLVGVTSVIVAA